MNFSQNVPRALTAAGVLGLFAAGAWLVPLLPAQAQDRPREEAGQPGAQELREAARKLEQMRRELDNQRRALEQQARELERAMERLGRSGAARENRPGREDIDKIRDKVKVEIKKRAREAEQRAREVEQRNREKRDVRVIIVKDGEQRERELRNARPGAGPRDQGDLNARLDRVERALAQALGEIKSLRREVGRRGPGMPGMRPPGSGGGGRGEGRGESRGERRGERRGEGRGDDVPPGGPGRFRSEPADAPSVPRPPRGAPPPLPPAPPPPRERDEGIR